MLKKSHSLEHLEDFGLVNGTKIELYDAGLVKASERMKLSSVVRINALWMEKDIKVRCHVAATKEEKIAGLTRYASLDANEGLFFPYPGGEKVAFHQGGVKYPLDILFLKQNYVIKKIENTKISSTETWDCNNCDAVVEVNGGFCDEKNVSLGDIVVYSAVSQVDIAEVTQERVQGSALTAFADLI